MNLKSSCNVCKCKKFSYPLGLYLSGVSTTKTVGEDPEKLYLIMKKNGNEISPNLIQLLDSKV